MALRIRPNLEPILDQNSTVRAAVRPLLKGIKVAAIWPRLQGKSMGMNRFTCMLPMLALALATAMPGARAEDNTIDLVVVEKAKHRMELISGGRVTHIYTVALGFAPNGDKQQEGDGRTPEGQYVIESRNASSKFHLSLKISYPDAADRADAAARGVAPGGDIFIHGAPAWWALPGQPPGDWTRGCIAVTDAEIEEIWALVPDGTPVEIRP
jgi:murein L,D-transpeptidase YafK